MLVISESLTTRPRRWLLFLSVVSALGCDGERSSRGAADPASNAAVGAQTNSVAPSRSTSIELTLDRFQNVTASLGLSFDHQPVEHEQTFFMPRIVGSGAAFLDYDADGRLDIYCLQNSGPNASETNRLYRQQDDGKFQDVTEDSGLGIAGFGMGVACGDVNNDGRVDIVLNEYGRSRLLLNQTVDNNPRFKDISSSAGIDNRMWGTSTCFVDYDRDGWLDLVLVNYVTYDPSRWCADGRSKQDFCGPDAFPGRVTKLYRNLGGPLPQFEDVSVSSGLAEHPGPGLGVYCADFDGDRWPDIFIANDGKPNHLWINQRDGTFSEEAVMRGVGYNSMGKSEADMGIAIGDVDDNGMFDIFVTHLSEETHTLWSQGPRGVFTDRTATTGLTKANWRGTGFGTVMADIDNDGDQDLLVANGRVTRDAGPTPEFPPGLSSFWQPYAQRDQLWLNQGEGGFVDVSEANRALCNVASVSRGMASADFNNDGALDILVTHVSGPPTLLQNRAELDGRWLRVRAIDPALRRDAYGSEVYVTANNRTWMRSINPGYSYLCSNDPRAHFGLGEVSETDHIRVIWPDGYVEQFDGGPVNCQIELKRGDGQPVADDELSIQ